MKKYFILSLAVFATLTSCVRSLHPLAENENEMVFMKELVGKWMDEDSTYYLVDRISGSDKMYGVAIIETRKGPKAQNYSDTSYFRVGLVNIQGKLFLDCVAEMEKFENRNVGESAVNSLLPTHVIIRLRSVKPNSMELASMDQEKLQSLFNQKKVDVRHERIGKDDLLLTEDPVRLKRKLIELEKFPSIFNVNHLARIQ